MNTTCDDAELSAMSNILRTLTSLGDVSAQVRVLSWVSERLSIKNVTLGTENRAGFDDDMSENLRARRHGREGTVNTVATKLGADSCRTLLVAAAAYLALYRGEERFSREKLVTCAKESRFWKKDYGVQTSVNLTRMCNSGELIEKGKDVFGVSPKKEKELEKILSDEG